MSTRIRMLLRLPSLGLIACGTLAVSAEALAIDSLLSAVKAGDQGAVTEWLARGDADPNESDPDGTTALAWAAHNDDVAIARALLDAGADVAAKNRYGVGALHLASENGSATMLSALLEHGADPDGGLPAGETALMTAARAGDIEALRVLIDAGADVNAKEGWKGQTALMWAAAEDNAEAIRLLLDAGADIDARSDTGEFGALTFAVRAGAIEATRALLDAGADVNETMYDGTSMLVLAVTNAHYELAGVLLDHGADPNAADQGWTALHQIAWSRRWNRGFNLPGPVQTGDLSGLDLASKLVSVGADIDARQTAEPIDGNRNKQDRIGATPFLLAAKSCDLPLMRRLLELGADASIPTADNTTAVMVAAGVGIWAPGENPGTHEECLNAVKLAYENGGGAVTDRNDHNDTVIHGAVFRGGAVPIIEYLAELGAPLDVVDDRGWTPLYAAQGVEYTPDVLKRYPEAFDVLSRLLRERGLDPADSLVFGGVEGAGAAH